MEHFGAGQIRGACKLLKRWSGRRGSNPRRPAWEAGILPLNYSRTSANLLVSSFEMRSGIARSSLWSLLSTVFRLFGRQNRQQNGQHGQGENVPSDVSVLQSPHHLELHSSANSVGPIRLGPPAFRSVADYRFFGETGASCHCEEVQPARRKIPAFNKEHT